VITAWTPAVIGMKRMTACVVPENDFSRIIPKSTMLPWGCPYWSVLMDYDGLINGCMRLLDSGNGLICEITVYKYDDLLETE